MNKLAIALSAALSLGAAASANAAEATISFEGTITDTTCEISLGGAGSAGQKLVLPTLGKAAITSTAVESRETAFNLVLGKPGAGNTCPGNTAELIFDQTNVDTTGGLKNSHAAVGDAAKNVELALVYSDVELDLQSARPEATVDAGIYTYPMKARYRKTGSDPVEAGKFESSLGLDVLYR